MVKLIITIILLVVLVAIWGLGIWYLSTTFYFQWKNRKFYVPFIPSDSKGIAAMVKAVGLRGNERVIDIGSGSGTILFYLAKHFANLQLTGIELNSFLHVWAKLRQKLFFPKANLKLINGDAQKFNYGDYDVIFLFMLSSFVDGVLVPKFNKELRKGTKVVSYVFRMKSADFEEQEVDLEGNGWKSKVFVYTKT